MSDHGTPQAAGTPVPRPARPDAERGSALITTMMVMVILTAMGLSFLVVSDTENQIAIADRDARQVLYVATSGAKLVESWFNVPDEAFNPFVPDRTDCDLSLRVGDSDYDGTEDIDVPANGAAQRYRGGTATGAYRLFDKPFRGAIRDTFWGSFEQPDLLIANDPDDPDDYLSRMSSLFNTDGSSSLEGVEITEIRIYAPPYDEGLMRRFGVCTASVTAAKVLTRQAGDVSARRRVAQRRVTIVLQEMPFPAPGAGIESAASVNVAGNFGVHWGGTYSEADLAVQNGANFPGNAIPRENTSRYRFANFSPAAPDLDNNAANGRQNLLTQLLQTAAGVAVNDPWINFRANGSILEAPNEDDQPWPYDYNLAGGLQNDRSIFFQNQTYTFPEMDYDFWKRFTQQRARNAHYLKYAGLSGGEPAFRKNGVGNAHTFAHWVNTENPGVEPGVFFFDTTNSINPQNGGGGTLTPTITINSSVVDSPSGDFIMEGLIFSNAEIIDTSGISGKAVLRRVNMPGEPFLDVGIDIDRDGTVGNTLEEAETVGNGVWDFAYFGSTESDGQYYDEVYGTPAFEAFEMDHRFGAGVVPHDGDDPTTLADTVHEPFLNLRYPPSDDPAAPCRVDFDIEATVDRPMGGDRDEDGVEDTLTSLRDRRGALVDLEVIVNGIWYNQGRYDGAGNLPVYGAVLMREGFTATGTPDVWFNEGILLGDFPPPEMKIPRVYVSQVDTD